MLDTHLKPHKMSIYLIPGGFIGDAFLMGGGVFLKLKAGIFSFLFIFSNMLYIFGWSCKIRLLWVEFSGCRTRGLSEPWCMLGNAVQDLSVECPFFVQSCLEIWGHRSHTWNQLSKINQERPDFFLNLVGCFL